MKTAYLVGSKIIKKSFFGDKTKDSYVKVKIIGIRSIPSSMGSLTSFLVELPNKEKKEVKQWELFFNKK